MKTKRGSRMGLAVVGVVALLTAGCAGDDAKEVAASTATQVPNGKPSIAIASPKSGAVIQGNVVTLDLRVSGITIVKADGDASGKTGHLHAFIDRVPVAVGEGINKEPGIVHSVDNPLVLTGLSQGEHEITVVLGDGKHERLSDAEDSIKVIVAGPAVDASANPMANAGSTVRIDFAATGVSIVKADGDTSGKTGHFHVFVDRPLPRPGEPIDKPADGSIVHTADSFVEIPNLAPGEHTFYVVLGDGNHVVMNPLVADKVTVTVQ